MEKIGKIWKKKQGVSLISGANSYIIPKIILPPSSCWLSASYPPFRQQNLTISLLPTDILQRN